MNSPNVTAQAPTKPLPKPIQHAILVITMFGGVIWLVRPSTGPCTVKQTYNNTNICVVSGKLKAIDQTNKDLNAKRLGGAELDEIVLEDETGGRSVYFDAAKLSFDGRATARVTGKEMDCLSL